MAHPPHDLFGMLQHRLIVLDRFVPLPAVGRKDYVEGIAIHTSHRTIQRG